MRHHRRVARRMLVCLALVLAIVAKPLATNPFAVSNDPRVQSGPDSVGGLPSASPSGPTGAAPEIPLSQIATPTPGVVVDGKTRLPVPGVLVVVTNALGDPIAIDTTNAQGKFVLYLCDDMGLELAMPAEGIAGIPIHAGDALMVVLP
jgi:hypothetical protein